ncbi:OmpH family outer membrane protein [Sphingomonas cavernae]|uniref:OmpH family outer membrane protein n=1 Tax=Sphingomonas cavernae TaxID=2320861 RepID=A0A418WM87_9SPHN|nr:OmpH family outer membrane protein [Sphingomonas cavernae]RJF91105.1 OmpH family outer membrane protein [Sphingomonas cavernae]
MTKIIVTAALSALAIATPFAAQAQKLNPAVIAVVNNERVFTECTACKAAQAQLQTQLQQIEQRAQQLGQPLQTEAQSLEAAVKALNGKQPDAAMQQRATAFQQKQGAAQKEISDRQQTFQRNRAFVAQQIQAKLNPIVQQVMTARGATVALDTQATLASAASIDVTNDVLAQLNQQLPSVSTTAPAPAAQPAQPQPQGR